MPIFLTQQQAYRLLQRLLPSDVFPDGAPSAFFHTAEMWSYALNIQSAYGNASGIYQNFFPQSCDAGTIGFWELKCFGVVNPQGLSTLAERQQIVVSYLHTAAPGISQPAMVQVVNRTIPGLTFEVVAWCCGQGEGGWVLDESQLDIETYLNDDTQFALPVGPNLCSQTPADWGMTQEDWDNLLSMAYTYEVRIYGTTLTTAQRTVLSASLTTYGPARSQFVINDGLDISELLGDPLC